MTKAALAFAVYLYASLALAPVLNASSTHTILATLVSAGTIIGSLTGKRTSSLTVRDASGFRSGYGFGTTRREAATGTFLG